MAAAVSSGSTASVGGLNSTALLETAAVAVIDKCLPVQDVANLVTDYLAPTRFGAAEWHCWFGVDVGQEPKFSREITLFWNQPDPVDPTQLVSATHLPPVLCPQFINKQPFTLRLLGKIVKNPQNGGNASNYVYQTLALEQYQDTPAGPACWLVMKKGVGARNKPCAAQVDWLKSLPGSYEATTPAIHLATVVFTRHVISGEWHLGKSDAQDGHWFNARCQELLRGSRPSLIIGSFSSNGLHVDSDFSTAFFKTGVVALRKF